MTSLDDEITDEITHVIDDDSYMQLTDMAFTDGKDGATAVFKFTNTKEPRSRTIICMPREDAIPATLEALYHKVNLDYPEAAEHLAELVLYFERLGYAET